MIYNRKSTQMKITIRQHAARAKTAILTVAVLATLASCAQPRPRHDASADPCHPLAGALVGGAIGAVLGGEKHRVRGLAIGAGIGALGCVAYNHKVQQTKSAEQVGLEYRERTNSELPPDPVVTSYRTSSRPEQAHAGDEITVTTHLEIVPGRGEPLHELREEFAIVDPNGVERSRIAKTPVPAGSQGGAFVSTLQFTIPKGVPGGSYQVQSQVFLNGKQVQSSVVNLMVASIGTEQNLTLQVAVLDRLL